MDDLDLAVAAANEYVSIDSITKNVRVTPPRCSQPGVSTKGQARRPVLPDRSLSIARASSSVRYHSRRRRHKTYCGGWSVKEAADPPREGLGVGGESGCVPSVVTSELTLQVAGWLCEGSQELHNHREDVSASFRRTCHVPIHWPTDIPEDKKQILGSKSCIRAPLCIIWTLLSSADPRCRGWAPSAHGMCTSTVMLLAIRLGNGCSPQRGQGHTTRWRRGSPACFPAMHTQAPQAPARYPLVAYCDAWH